MNDNHTAPSLPESVTRIDLPNKVIYLVGTAHLSRQSVTDVKTAIFALQPDTVCIELCPSRFEALTDQDRWGKMDIIKVIRENKALFVLVQLLMSALYRKIGHKLGIEPGAEMTEAVNQARTVGANLELIDRNVNITLKRVWGGLTWWQKLKMLGHILGGLAFKSDIEAKDIEELKDKDQLEAALDSVARSFPQAKTRLIDERDCYLAQSIRRSPGKRLVAVLGAGHIQGVINHIWEDQDLAPLLQIPPGSYWPLIFKWLIPVLILILIGLGFFHGGAEHSIQSISIWILVNGFFSSLAVALALAHPLTILSTFVAAPLTSLNPTIAAGWVAGLVQAWTKKPTIADLEAIPRALGSVRIFWLNPLCRILLVVVLANLGSSLGTFVAGGWIAARFFE
ncbi:conjugal transfer protein TraB [candidate division MSBL1 archaeon SCGC-AAA385M11]|nr:conjugal transfer protein TraB [candidate division MSBL1 archaeon SCGC-AAA385M11]